MAGPLLFDRVHETTIVTGTGPATLLGAYDGSCVTFGSVLSIGDTVYYEILQTGTAWEVGIGTYSGANTLTRTTVLFSCVGSVYSVGTPVSFGAGTKDVVITADKECYWPKNGDNPRWDYTNKWFGVGVTPAVRLHVQQSTGFGRTTTLVGDDTTAISLVEGSFASATAPLSDELSAASTQLLVDYTGTNPASGKGWIGMTCTAQVPATNATAALANTTLYGVYAVAAYGGTGGYNIVIGCTQYAAATGTGTVAVLIGSNCQASKSGTGVVAQAFALQATINNTGAGAITAAVGIKINTPALSGGGTIGTNHGLYIDNQQPTGVAAGYAINVRNATDSVFLVTSQGDVYARGPVVDVRTYGTHCDLQVATDGAYASASTITSSSFLAADIGKLIIINGAAAATAITTGTLTTNSGSPIVTISAGAFTQADQYKWIAVPGAGVAGAILYGTIAAVTSATTIYLSVNCSTSQVAVALGAAVVRFAGWVRGTIANVVGTTVTLSGITKMADGTAGTVANTNLVQAPLAWATDDSPAINTAFASVPYGSVLLFPAANYCVGTTVDVLNPVSVRGVGEVGTVFWHFGSGVTDCIRINYNVAAKYYSVHWSDFTIVSKGNHGFGVGLLIGNVGFSAFDNISVSGSGGGRIYDGIWFANCSQTYTHNLRVSGCFNNGVTIGPRFAPTAGANDNWLVDLWLSDTCGFDGNLQNGIYVSNDFANVATFNVQGLYFGAFSVFANGGNGVWINVGNKIQSLIFHGTILDSNKGLGLLVNGNVNILRMESIWVSFNGNTGYLFGGGGNTSGMYLGSGVSDCNISNGIFILSGQNGLVIDGAQRVRLHNCTLQDNSYNGDALYYGLVLQGVASRVYIGNCRIASSNVYQSKQNGLIVTSTVSNLDLINNFCDPNEICSGSITSGTGTLTLGAEGFTAVDGGKYVRVKGAGVAGADLIAQITTFTSTTVVTVSPTAGTTVIGAGVSWALSTGAQRYVSRTIDPAVKRITESGNRYDVSYGQSAASAFTDDNLAATYSDVILINNTTPATAGVPVQQSSSLRFSSHVWNTTATAADNFADARITLIPTSGLVPTSKLSFAFGVGTTNQPTLTEQASLDSAGNLALGGNVTPNGLAVSVSQPTLAQTIPANGCAHLIGLPLILASGVRLILSSNSRLVIQP